MSNPSDSNRSVENRPGENRPVENRTIEYRTLENLATNNRAVENLAVSNQSGIQSNKKKQKQSVKNVKNRSHANRTLRVNRNQPINNHNTRLTKIEIKVKNLEKNVEELQKYTKKENCNI